MSAPRQNFVKCPCCWERFPLSQTMWIAAHEDLKDDYRFGRSGDTKPQRFLPERFTPGYRAIDERGEICKREFACPHCHMEIPERFFECEPMYVSIVGTKGAGKTFFLTALHHRLQQNRFKRDYDLDLFFDAGLYASKNETLAKNVNTLFHSAVPPDAFVTLEATLPGDLETMITVPGGREYNVANPFTYILSKGGKRHAPCLYDHSGESFKGSNIDEARNTFTQHILDSDIFFFLYDPTQNANCVKDYAAKYGRQIYRDGKIDQDELVGMESAILNPTIAEQSHHVFGAVANYIRSFADPTKKIIEGDQYTKYICIVATKCDAWEKCLSEKAQQHLQELPSPEIIASVSSELEHWLERHDSAFTSTVRDFAKHYSYVPISAAGRQVKKSVSGLEGYDIGVEALSSRWIDVPFLCALYPPY